MNDLGKRLLFRLVRILLIAAVLMTALVMLNPERYLPPDAVQEDALGGVQAGLLLLLAVLAIGIRVWVVRRHRNNQRR